MNQYPHPVSRLLNLGDPSERREWPVYTALGLTREHIPDLIRMIQDDDLNNADTESREVWRESSSPGCVLPSQTSID